MAVMGSGDIAAGKHQQTSKFRQSVAKDATENAAGSSPEPARPHQAQMCGAMTQQGPDSRAPSQPQEFVRLVGSRDPKARQQGGR